MIEIKLKSTNNGLGGLTPIRADQMAECAAYCMDSMGHSSGVEMSVVQGRKKKNVNVLWDFDIGDHHHKTYRDEKRTTDEGAMCIALLLTLELTDYNDFEISEGNNGFDVYLSNESDELNFMGARLEISGIRNETASNTVKRRIKKKLDRFKRFKSQNSSIIISVTDFGAPKSHYLEK